MTESYIDNARKVFEDTRLYLNGERYILLERSADDLVANDVLTAIFIGLIGSILSNSKKLNRFLDEIHSNASLEGNALLDEIFKDPKKLRNLLKKPEKLLAMLLFHKSDKIDGITRGGKPFCTYLHRLYGGHDPLSLKNDNPFLVLCRQYGIPKGILQAGRHLVADTFSKNGGVLPGSSFLDYRRADGTVGNLIDDWARQFARGSGFSPQEVYANLFSIRMQDIGSTTVINLLINLYAKSVENAKERQPLSKIGICQLKIIALLSTVIGSAATGIVIHHGVPKMNYPAVAALLHETGRLDSLNKRDVSDIHNRTELLKTRLDRIKYAIQEVV